MDSALESRNPCVKLYYREQEDDVKYINFILLSPSTIVEDSDVSPNPNMRDCSFCVRPDGPSPNGIIYYLHADSSDLKLRWVVVIRSLCSLLALRWQQPLEGPASSSSSSSKPRGKAGKLLGGGGGGGWGEPRGGAGRGSLDVVVERGEVKKRGGRVCARVGYGEEDNVLSWWEYSATESVDLTEEGTAEWQTDFSWEGSLVGATIRIRVTTEKGDEIIGEAVLDPRKLGSLQGPSWTQTVTLPLVAPVWDPDNDWRRAGGVLKPEDVEKQGAKRSTTDERGSVTVKIAWSSDMTKGMLARLGTLGDPLPLRVGTGDVFLFSQNTGAARLTRLFTWSTWSHAAVAVKKRNGALVILEATGSGVQLYDVQNVWRRYHRSADIGVCRLMVPNGLSDEDHENLYTFIDSVVGRPYEKSLLSLVNKVARGSRSRTPSDVDLNNNASPSSDQLASTTSLPSSSSSQRNSLRPTDAAVTEVFCSELVANVFRALGLLGQTAQLQLLPKHFDVTESSPLKLERAARLFPPRILAKNEESDY